jgi:hypothetical protein
MKEMCHMGLEVTCPLSGREGARGMRLFWSVCSGHHFKLMSFAWSYSLLTCIYGVKWNPQSLYFWMSKSLDFFEICELILAFTHLVIFGVLLWWWIWYIIMVTILFQFCEFWSIILVTILVEIDDFLVYYYGENFCEVWWFFGLKIFNMFHSWNS